MDFKTQPRKKREVSESANSHINRLIRKTIDQTKQEDYNLDHGKSDRIEGSRKEVKNGNLYKRGSVWWMSFTHKW
jgi:hypothetical protein